MSRTGYLKVSKKGRVRLPKGVRGRWSLHDGGEVAVLDLGGGLLLIPSSTAGLSEMPSQPFVEAEHGASGSEPGIERAWPPDPNERIAFSVAGESWVVPWGRHDEFGTPAYWIDQTLTGGYTQVDEPMDLKTATVWGLLHGPDMLDEVGNARLSAVMELLKENETPSAAEVAEVLSTPIEGFGRYRYANRKAALISEAVSQLDSDTPPNDPGRLQDYLMWLKGVGPQTSVSARRESRLALAGSRVAARVLVGVGEVSGFCVGRVRWRRSGGWCGRVGASWGRGC